MTRRCMVCHLQNIPNRTSLVHHLWAHKKHSLISALADCECGCPPAILKTPPSKNTANTSTTVRALRSNSKIINLSPLEERKLKEKCKTPKPKLETSSLSDISNLTPSKNHDKKDSEEIPSADIKNVGKNLKRKKSSENALLNSFLLSDNSDEENGKKKIKKEVDQINMNLCELNISQIKTKVNDQLKRKHSIFDLSSSKCVKMECSSEIDTSMPNRIIGEDNENKFKIGSRIKKKEATITTQSRERILKNYLDEGTKIKLQAMKDSKVLDKFAKFNASSAYKNFNSEILNKIKGEKEEMKTWHLINYEPKSDDKNIFILEGQGSTYRKVDPKQEIVKNETFKQKIPSFLETSSKSLNERFGSESLIVKAMKHANILDTSVIFNAPNIHDAKEERKPWCSNNYEPNSDDNIFILEGQESTCFKVVPKKELVENGTFKKLPSFSETFSKSQSGSLIIEEYPSRILKFEFAKIFVCHFCNMELYDSSLHKLHIQTHLNESIITDILDMEKVFPIFNEENVQKRKHVIKDFLYSICEICKTEFSNTTALQKHVRLSHI